MNDKQQALEIIDKRDFFNDRAGRELWNDKPKEIQDEDIRNAHEEYEQLKEYVLNQPKVGEWIPVEERLPEEHKLIDDETGYYNKSDEVLCCCKNEYNEFEYWIDYTIDGEWQYSEYIDGDEKYWQPLPEPFKGD